MLTREGAAFRMLVELRPDNERRDWWDRVIVVEERTLERPWGWVFFTTTRAIQRDGHRGIRFVGPAIYFVDRETGDVDAAFAGASWLGALERYERRRDERSLRPVAEAGRAGDDSRG